MWYKVTDKLPEHNSICLVKVKNIFNKTYFAIAEYNKHFGFSSESSGYDITCHDDSGLTVYLSGEVIEWKEID
jgi:hypothetical protein